MDSNILPQPTAHLLGRVMGEAGREHFDEVQAIRFFFLYGWDRFCPKKFSPIPKSQRFSPMLSSRSFVLFSFKLRPVMDFELIFASDVRVKIHFVPHIDT